MWSDVGRHRRPLLPAPAAVGCCAPGRPLHALPWARMSEVAVRTPSRRRGGLLLVVGIASSAFFLWLVFRNADLPEDWHALKGADLGLVLRAAVVIQGVSIAQGARWREIADVFTLSVRRFYALVLAG